MNTKKEKISFSVFASTPETIDEIVSASNQAEDNIRSFHPKVFYEFNNALDYLTYGQITSRLFVIEYTNDFELLCKIVAQIHNDPWLHGTVIVVIADKLTEAEILKLLNIGVIDFMTTNEIRVKVPTILKIVTSNLELFESEQFLLENITRKKGKIKIKNNLRVVPKVANLIMSICYAAGFRNYEAFSRISLSLHEMITNAIEHGNCGVGFEMKSKILVDSMDMYAAIDERAALPENKDKRVTICYEINNDQATFTVRDEGLGFEINSIPSPRSEENIFAVHGRGILMTKNFADEMQYNDKGNMVRLIFYNNNEIKRRASHLMQFTTGEIVFLNPDDVLFEAGSESDYFYYILTGKMGVYIKDNHRIAVLTPEDMFVGEMSFLHHNKRTGTVKALTKAQLLPISRSGFIDMVKKYPYYGVFLARLLTKRLILRNRSI
ncbi:MAG: ATP-binding protein [Leptospiraceae bacterium]|nr:ATP-binding protein [Leptospiraceae bacterium]MBK9498930.1 ATP-binding protein [Leptospiraceae bacterium]MBL0263836.1 ATP-binding protein [Leptospiraceae bacterium]